MENEKNSVGPVIGIIIVLAVIVIGGLYFWGSELDKVQEQATTEDQTASVVKVDDSLESIESDLNATADVDTSADVKAIDAEMVK